jgi:hypothetical protein
MAKRSLGDLNTAQRLVLRDWSKHMGVSDVGMMNMLNSLDNLRDNNPWNNLDIVAGVVQDCSDCCGND